MSAVGLWLDFEHTIQMARRELRSRLVPPRGGAVCRYFAVPATVFDSLIAAESKGVYFNRNIRNRVRYQRLP